MKSILTLALASLLAASAYAGTASSSSSAGSAKDIVAVASGVGSSGVRVNNAHVVATDVAASNGVIHVIDTVLLPQ